MQAKDRSCSRRWPGPTVTRSVMPLVLGLATLATAPGSLAADPPDDLFLQPIASGLVSPVDIQSPRDGSGRVFVVEQRGTIRVIQNDTLQPGFFLDIQNKVDDFGFDQGLLGLAFHPDFATNGYFHVNYTESATPPPDCPAGADCLWNTVIARYEVSAGNSNLADPNSEVRLLVINQDYSNHNGGNTLFGPDGYLYIGMGDGGSGGDPRNRAQSMNTLLGKMLRIDVDGGGFAADCGRLQNYGVPANNPFRDGTGGACDAIWALGLRNPWRWSFDRLTGDLYIGDVGQHTWEEVDFEPWSSPGGSNYGWRCYEGDHTYNTNGCGPQGNYDFPIIEYDQRIGDRQAVTGGYVYRGPTIAGLQGTYVHADYASGEIWFTTPDGLGGWNTDLWQDTSHVVSSFGEDERGELYLVNLNGSIYRFQSSGSIFADGFDFGDTSIWSTVVP